jgi:transposase
VTSNVLILTSKLFGPCRMASASAMRKNWTALTRYCENPDLSIDKNATERALCCSAVGRANWTVSAAVPRRFVTSCELVKIDPFAWFRDVLARIADCPMSRLDELLPGRWALDYPASFSADLTLTKS